MLLCHSFPQLKSKDIKLIKKKAKEDLKTAELAKELLLAQAPQLIQQATER